MKTKKSILKKSLSTALVVMCAMLLSITSVFGQTYQTIYWDNYTHTSDVPYCSCDFIKCVPPEGVTNITWFASGAEETYIGDILILESEFNGQVTCFYNGAGYKSLYLRPLAAPISPLFPTDTTVCVEFLTLDAGNYNQYGFTTYEWSTSTGAQTISVGAGIYTVNITNICGSVSDEITVIYDNPNAPHLGADQSFCLGSSITLNPGTNALSYLWSKGGIPITTATGPTLTVSEGGMYSVYVVDNEGCNGRDEVEITVLLPIGEEICYVEFDTITLKNNINWTSNLPDNTVSMNIYRETSLNQWTLLGNVALGVFNYIDMSSNPSAQSYSYKIASIDTCGNESEFSSFHTTITLLSTYDSGTDTYGFSWSPYHGLTVSDYYLYGIDVSNNITQIAMVPGNVYMYNYVNPSMDYVKYFVGFETPICGGGKNNIIVKSNWVQSVATSILNSNSVSFNVYPNPADNIIEISGLNSEFEIQIVNVLGQVLLHEKNNTNIDISMLPAGTYSVIVNCAEKTEQKTIIVY